MVFTENTRLQEICQAEHLLPIRDCLISGGRFFEENGLLTLDCSQCGAGRTRRHVELDKLDELELYLDVSSVEIFINDGEVSLTSRCFFDDSVRNVAASCNFTLYQAPRIEIESRDSA